MTAPRAVKPNRINGFPTETNLQTCPPEVRQELQQLYSQLQGFLRINHNPDGSHGNVEADTVYSESGFREFGRDDFLGVSVDVPWAPSNFSASAGSVWAPTAAQQVYLRACRFGDMLFLSGRIIGTNVGTAAAGELFIKIPYIIQNNGVASDFVCVGQSVGQLLYSNAGAAFALGFCSAFEGSRYISLQNLGNWAVTAGNNTSVIFSIVCPIKQNPL